MRKWRRWCRALRARMSAARADALRRQLLLEAFELAFRSDGVNGFRLAAMPAGQRAIMRRITSTADR